MADRNEIIAYLDELLDSPGFPDYGPNGLQVPGAAEVTTVVTGVSASLDLFEAARERGAELVLAHHGMFWGDGNDAISPQRAAQLKLLLGNDISLAAYHLPLDAHPEVGNNALLIEALGLRIADPFGDHKGRSIGWLAETTGDTDAEALRAQLAQVTGREPLFFDFGPAMIKRVAVVTGSAPDYLQAAVDAGADAFITGEPAERVMNVAKECGIHFAAAGHYATETFGVIRLGELLAEKFDVQHEFVDLPNPI
ncbi:MAG: Nif3-like dinuclear metal center hexameric protein [Solirubrobacterales bacterium]